MKSTTQEYSKPLLLNILNKQTPLLDKIDYAVWLGDVEKFLSNLPMEPIFDLIITSPPYNIGKPYEKKNDLQIYLEWQKRIIDQLIPRLKSTGSICWQVGNFIDNGYIVPLDIEFAPMFKEHKLQMRNRIIWHFGHGLHSKKRFSGRYEVVLWYTKSNEYTFNLDDVRVPSKYPGKRHFKGPKAGQLSGHPLGKNPDDVWNIPNVKSNHVEKTIHPCQFPVGLIERLTLALTNKSELIFDPFAGVASAGVAAAIHSRRFWGCELNKEYAKIGITRLEETLRGQAKYRPHDKPLYDHTKSNLSLMPENLNLIFEIRGKKMRYCSISHFEGDQVVTKDIMNEVADAINQVAIKVSKGAASKIRDDLLGYLVTKGWSSNVTIARESEITITSLKDKVGLCLQTGNIARMYADLMKLQKLYIDKTINSAVMIVPTYSSSKILGSNITNAARLEKELTIFKKVIFVPIIIFSIE